MVPATSHKLMDTYDKMAAVCNETVDYVMVLVTSHKLMATYDKMAAVCTEMVDVRNGVGYIS